MIMVDINKKFAETLGILLTDEKRCTQTELAEAVGLKQPTISGVISGSRTCNYGKRLKIASYFGMTMDEFLSYDPLKTDKRKQLERSGDEKPVFFDKEDILNAIENVLYDREDHSKEHLAGHKRVLDYNELKNAKHHKIIDQFQQPKLAEEINVLLLEIEKIKKARFKKIKAFLEAELEELLEECQRQDPKKRTVNGQD